MLPTSSGVAVENRRPGQKDGTLQSEPKPFMLKEAAMSAHSFSAMPAWPNRGFKLAFGPQNQLLTIAGKGNDSLAWATPRANRAAYLES